MAKDPKGVGFMTKLSMTDIGARLRESRMARGLTQDEVAGHLGVTRPVVSKIEAGNKLINSIELLNLAELYGVAVDQILSPATESMSFSFRGAAKSPDSKKAVMLLEKVVRETESLEDMLARKGAVQQ